MFYLSLEWVFAFMDRGTDPNYRKMIKFGTI